MSGAGPLARRLAALEQVQCACELTVRVYATHCEADADSAPPGPGRRVLAIITGVPRCPDGEAL